MRKHTLQAPPAKLTLCFHPPTLARVDLVYQPVPARLARALLSLVFFWGAIPLLIWVPPHYPWVVAAFVAGAYLPHRFWTRRYRVRSFTGFCPRCGHRLDLRCGTKIDLPHVLPCLNCHFEPWLEVTTAPREKPGTELAVNMEHRSRDCTGVWVLDYRGPEWSLTCEKCGARHPAIPETHRAAAAENEQGRVLAQLTSEGRFLI